MSDKSDCPKCGEWRDAPDADCAACGYIPPRPCGDPSGRCLYAGPHDGPHKVPLRAVLPDAADLFGPDNTAAGHEHWDDR